MARSAIFLAAAAMEGRGKWQVGEMRDYHNLDVWKKAHAVTLSIYRVTRTFPRDERYGLTAQMRGAARSVPANIAEGCGRPSRTDLARFLDIAMGSANELAYYVELARDLDYLPVPAAREFSDSVAEVARMLVSLATTIRTTP